MLIFRIVNFFVLKIGINPSAGNINTDGEVILLEYEKRPLFSNFVE